MYVKRIMICLCIMITAAAELYSEEALVIEYNDEAGAGENQIIVSASRMEQKAEKVSLPVKSYDSDYLEENQFTSMVDLLDSTPGFSSRYEYHSTMYLRGFSGNNILLLQDGAVRISNSPKGMRANKLAAFNVEKVEIIRGPGSVVYGSGALTGIVHVITTDIFKEKGLDVDINSRYAFNNNERDNSILATYNTGSAAFNVGARYRVADNYTLPDGSEAEHSYLEDKDIVGKVGYKLSDKQTLIFSTDIHQGGPWSKAAGFNGKPNLEIYYDQEDTYHFSGLYEAEDILFTDKLSLMGYYDYERTVLGKKWTTDLDVVTSDSKSYMKDQYGGGSVTAVKGISNNTLTSGFDGYVYRVWIDNTEYSIINGPESSYEESESIQGGGTDTLGYFIQDTIDFKPLTLVTGARYDIARVKEGDYHAESLDSVAGYESEKLRSAVSGNVGWVYNFLKKYHWSFNVGRAFRMPTYSEMYSETLTGKGIISGNPEVEPEYSLNFDSGIKGAVQDYFFEVNGFINFYQDLIKESLVDPDDTDSGYLYGNVDKARVYGGEIENGFNFVNLIGPFSVLTPSLGYTHYIGDDLSGRSYLVFDDKSPLLYVPNPEFAAKLRYQITRGRSAYFASIGCNYARPQNRVGEGDDPYPSYHHIDGQCGVTVSNNAYFDHVRILIAVKNLTNNEYYLYNDYLPAKGRDISIQLNANF